MKVRGFAGRRFDTAMSFSSISAFKREGGSGAACLCAGRWKPRIVMRLDMRISNPGRVTRTYVQRLTASPARVFPLLCPVREADWIEGWDPIAVWSESGIAEPDCVFITPSDTGEAIWYITQHSPNAGEVEMLKITPGVTACKLVIKLTPSAAGTDAEVTYTHTSLGPAGDAFIAGFTEEFYLRFMRDWESRLNHYLSTGNKLPAAHP